MEELHKCRNQQTTTIITRLHRSLHDEEANQFFRIDEQDFCVVDTRLKQYFPEYAHIWERCYSISGGEKCKSIDRVFELYSVIHSLPYQPKRVRVFGGGALQDLVGYSMATSMPDLPLILYPTTPGSIFMGHYSGRFSINWDRKKDRITVQANPAELRIDPFFLQDHPLQSLRTSFIYPARLGLAMDDRFFRLSVGFLDCAVNDLLDWDSYFELIRESHRLLAKAYEQKIVLFPGESMANWIMNGSGLQMDYTQALGCGLVLESYLAWKLGIGNELLFREIRQIWGSVFPEAKDLHSFLYAQMDLLTFLSMVHEHAEMTFSLIIRPGKHTITKIQAPVVEWAMRDFFLGQLHWEGVK